jgi:hypothetical protein
LVAKVDLAVEQRSAVDDVRNALVFFLTAMRAVLMRQPLREAVAAVNAVHLATRVGYPGAAAKKPLNAAALRHVPVQPILAP